MTTGIVFTILGMMLFFEGNLLRLGNVSTQFLYIQIHVLSVLVLVLLFIVFVWFLKYAAVFSARHLTIGWPASHITVLHATKAPSFYSVFSTR
jgi:hypothetical protein